jgi:hypothetical protein
LRITGVASRTDAQPVSRFRAFLPFLLDLVVPILAYVVLHRLGVSDVLALTVGGLATGVNATIGTLRRRRLDGIGLLVVLEITVSIGLLLVTNDARILLIKPSFYLALGAIYAFITCLVGRPIFYEAAKPFATRGDPPRLAAHERARGTLAKLPSGGKDRNPGLGPGLSGRRGLAGDGRLLV